jgi:mannose-6-phosphate isomerase-like protein (cupin superfamily)
MARPGDVIENRASKERIVFNETASSTAGELVEIESFIPPDGRPLGARAHKHPYQEERFEIRAGSGIFTVGRRTQRAQKGEVVTVPAGVWHRFVNEPKEELHLRVQLRPALRIENLFEVVFALARAGRTTRGGVPRNPLVGAALAREFIDEFVIRPEGLYRMAVAVGAGLGRVLGVTLPVRSGEG